jgi:hypothetical protein
MGRLILSAVAAAVLMIGILGCSRAEPIPVGAQVVHIAIDGSEIRLSPVEVRAGDVYLVLDTPADGSFTFVEHKAAADAVPGPLTAEDFARLARGDTEFTSASGLDSGGCSEDQNLTDRGKMGPCGNVMKVVVVAGTYAIVGGAPEPDPATGRMAPIAQLEVLP